MGSVKLFDPSKMKVKLPKNAFKLESIDTFFRNG
jgi:hypothetical protein